MDVTTVEIKCGEAILIGRLHLPSQPKSMAEAEETAAFPAVLIIPGFADTAVGMHNMHIENARALAECGYVVLRFDYSGLGESEGDFREFTATRGLEMVEASLKFLIEHPASDSNRIILFGFSLGGAYAVEAAVRYPQSKALVLWSPIAYMERVFTGFFDEGQRSEAAKQGWIDWMGWAVGERFEASAAKLNPLEAMRTAAQPVLVVQGSDDREVVPANGEAYAELGAKIHWIEGGDHLYSSVERKREAINVTMDWLDSMSNS